MSGSGSWIVPNPVPVFRFSFAEGNVINFLTISSIVPDHSPKAKAPPFHQAIGLAVLSVGTLETATSSSFIWERSTTSTVTTAGGTHGWGSA